VEAKEICAEKESEETEISPGYSCWCHFCNWWSV